MNVKNLTKQIAIFLLSVAVVAYLGLQLSLSVGQLIEVDYATLTDANEAVSTTGFLFRDEKVLSSQYKGTNTYFCADGEKVKKGTQVAAVYASSHDAGLQARINELNQKIKILEASSVSKIYSTGDISRLDEQISSNVLNIISSIDDGRVHDAAINQEELLITLNRRRAVLTAASGFDMQIEKCKNEKKALESQLTGEFALLETPSSGIFYSAVDGYENIFTTDFIESMTVEKFNSLYLATPSQAVLSNAVCKVVVSSKWYVTVSMEKREAAKLTENKPDSYLYSVMFPYSNNKTVPMTLEKKVSQTDSDSVVLVFSSSSSTQGVNFTRSQPVKIVKESHKGLRVPVTALRIIDGQKGVYSLDGNKVVFKTVETLYEENGYYICALPDENNVDTRHKTKLSLHDVIITEGNGIEIGQIVS